MKLDTENPGDVVGWATDTISGSAPPRSLTHDGGTRDPRPRRRQGASGGRCSRAGRTRSKARRRRLQRRRQRRCTCSSRNGTRTRLRWSKRDLADRQGEVIAEDQEVDAGGRDRSTRRRTISRRSSFNAGPDQWKVIDTEREGRLRGAREARRGDFGVISRDRRPQDLAGRATSPTTARSRTTCTTARRRRPTFLFVDQPKLERLQAGRDEAGRRSRRATG